MTKHINHIALGLFLLSFLTPAYRPDHDIYSGWACFGALSGNGAKDAWRFYYFGFVATNVIFLVLWCVSVFSKQRRSLYAYISLLPLVHVISWFALNFLDRKRQGLLPIEYGYFIWLTSFVLLSTSLFFGKNENRA